MRRPLAVCLAMSLACGVGYCTWPRIVEFLRPEKAPVPVPECCCADPRIPVPANRSLDVVDGFRGEVHPLLCRPAQMEVKAYWVAADTDCVDPRAPLGVKQLYSNVKPAIPGKNWSERDFSAFLPPASDTAVGQMWALDPERIAVFLKQFHPAVSTHVASVGRRPGPDGAFALLRAESSSHLDIVFRLHAEFDLVPHPTDLPLLHAWYSPACFLGRIVVNREAGMVEYFQFGVPTDNTTNLHTTCWTIFGIHAHKTTRVDRMELIGGSLRGLEGVRWTKQVDRDDAHDRLATVFYKFREIQFVPFERLLAEARERKRPILAVVLLGALDDQSC